MIQPEMDDMDCVRWEPCNSDEDVPASLDERELAVICSLACAATRHDAEKAAKTARLKRGAFKVLCSEWDALRALGPSMAFPGGTVAGVPIESAATRFAPYLISQMAREHAREVEASRMSPRMRSLADYPAVVPERDNPDILIRGRWLERGGSAFLISTAGTGKSIWATQFAVMMSAGVGFSGLQPWRPLQVWIIQSEDSPSRVSIDRDDIIAGLEEAFPRSAEGPIDWRDAARRVVFLHMTGETGAGFIRALREELEFAQEADALPDVIIINPFLAYIGGDVSSNRDVGAFLRGGVICGEQTEGLQALMEAFRVAALLAHHTGKPPSESEIKAWIRSTMPEYQCVGASDITNWGRSFITMMRVPGFPRAVMLTAGKNGAGLGWDEIGGARRRFMCWSDAPSCSGSGLRHFWREPSEDEVAAFTAAMFSSDTAARTASTAPRKASDDGPEQNALACAGHVLECIRDRQRVGNRELRFWARKRWQKHVADEAVSQFERTMDGHGLYKSGQDLCYHEHSSSEAVEIDGIMM